MEFFIGSLFGLVMVLALGNLKRLEGTSTKPFPVPIIYKWKVVWAEMMLIRTLRIKWIFIVLCVSSILSGCEQPREGMQGYIEARLAFISPTYSGVLQQLFVRRGDAVKPGQRLFVLEAQPESDSYLQAKADLNSAIAEKNDAEANVAHQKILLSRRQYLVGQKALDLESLDTARINYKNAVERLASANAKVESAKARLENAAWSRSKKSVVAGQYASVFDTYFLPDELVPANQAVLSLIIPSEIRAIFFVSEPQLSSIKVGNIVYIGCDGYNKRIPAKISFISERAELTPPVLYSSKEERSKFVYRVEADRLTNELNCFHPGQPVTIFFTATKKTENTPWTIKKILN